MVSIQARKPFYRNTQDTLEDVGISLRQLRYWQKQGLFEPELGPKTKYFTEDDTERLRFLKRLIHEDELNLRVETVNKLIESLAVGWDELALSNYQAFIDIQNRKLVSWNSAVTQL